MSFGDDTDRDQLFMDWVSGVIREFKGKGWTREQVSAAGKVSRNQLYQWEGRGKKGFSKPTPGKVKEFCEGLDIPWEAPFRILGWDTSATRRKPPQPDTTSEIERRISMLLVALDLPGISDDERRELDVQLARLQATQRMNEDAIKAADEALKRHGAA
jgi:transcriptional regulator with XRE-family HTH domain